LTVIRTTLDYILESRVAVEDTYESVYTVDEYRVIAMVSLVLAGALIIFLALVGAILKNSTVSTVASFLGALVVIVYWLTFAVLAPTQLVINGVCLNHQAFMAKQDYSMPALNVARDCILYNAFTEESFDSLSPDLSISNVRAGLKLQIEEMNKRLSKDVVPADPTLVDDFTVNDTPERRAALAEIKSELRRFNKLAADIDDPEEQKEAQDALKRVSGYINDIENILDITNCNRVTTVYEEVVKGDICEEADKELMYLWVSVLGIGLLMTAIVHLATQQRREIGVIAQEKELVTKQSIEEGYKAKVNTEDASASWIQG